MEIPKPFHEVFGEEQSLTQLATALLFSVGLVSGLFIYYTSVYASLPLWRRLLVFIFVFDIFAGAEANFIKGTNHYQREII